MRANTPLLATGRGLVYEKRAIRNRRVSEFLKALSSQDRHAMRKGCHRNCARSLGRVRLRRSSASYSSRAYSCDQFGVRPNSQDCRANPRPAGSSRTRSRIGQARPSRCTGDREFRVHQRPCSYKPKQRFRSHRKVSSAISVSKSHIGQRSTREKLIDALRNFANEAENSDWAMVYYAGHGIEFGGINYLIPSTQVRRRSRYSIRNRALSQVLRGMFGEKDQAGGP